MSDLLHVHGLLPCVVLLYVCLVHPYLLDCGVAAFLSTYIQGRGKVGTFAQAIWNAKTSFKQYYVATHLDGVATQQTKL